MFKNINKIIEDIKESMIEEVLEREVKKLGNSYCAFLPEKHFGKTCEISLIENEKQYNENLLRTVKKSGNSHVVRLPKNYLNGKVKIIIFNPKEESIYNN